VNRARGIPSVSFSDGQTLRSLVPSFERSLLGETPRPPGSLRSNLLRLCLLDMIASDQQMDVGFDHHYNLTDRAQVRDLQQWHQ
jgi:hypothetical protein